MRHLVTLTTCRYIMGRPQVVACEWNKKKHAKTTLIKPRTWRHLRWTQLSAGLKVTETVRWGRRVWQDGSQGQVQGVFATEIRKINPLRFVKPSNCSHTISPTDRTSQTDGRSWMWRTLRAFFAIAVVSDNCGLIGIFFAWNMWWFTNGWSFGIPSGDVKIAIENGHWTSEFSHETWWFSIVFCMFTRGYPWLPCFGNCWDKIHVIHHPDAMLFFHSKPTELLNVWLLELWVQQHREYRVWPKN